MDAKLRQFVRKRASLRCEYCHLPQLASPFLVFHIEHIQARQHVLDDSPENLALACPDCNFHKGPNLTTVDLLSRELVVLFHPRNDRWEDHFEYQGAVIVGRTRVGDATIRLLQMNTTDRIEMRAELQTSGDM